MLYDNRPSPELCARVALEKHRFRTTHSLGQNFLLSGALIDGLLDAAKIEPDDNVLEIGPGAGVMTLCLARRSKRVLAVEVDCGLEPVLDEVLAGQDNARVVFRDVMKADLRALTGEYFGGELYRVVANLPYYITADVLLKLTGCDCPPQSVCVMGPRRNRNTPKPVPFPKAFASFLDSMKCSSVLSSVQLMTKVCSVYDDVRCSPLLMAQCFLSLCIPSCIRFVLQSCSLHRLCLGALITRATASSKMIA